MTRSTTTWLARKALRPGEHRVDERGLAVVDVGDDRDIAHVGADRGRGVDGAHLAGMVEFEGRGGPGESFMGP
jgi:hypothetical protein